MSSWDGRSEHDDRDLLGVNSDVLFADPLGVRAKGSGQNKDTNRGRQQQAPASQQQRQPYAAASAQRLSSDPNLYREEEDSSWTATILGGIASFVAGGKQCCSMRDRTAHAEAAKKASETGRPPDKPLRREQDPDPSIGVNPPQHESSRGGGYSKPQSTNAPAQVPPKNDEFSRGRPLSPSPEDSLDETRHVKRELPPLNLGLNEDSISSLNETRHVQRPGGPGIAAEKTAPPPQMQQKAQEHAIEREAAPTGLSKKWEWPPWCLNFKQPSIEVWVEDDEMPPNSKEMGRWVNAEPQSRVVDKTGNDAYLCAEYEWDGEYYVQDFGPNHVRRRGHNVSVFDLFNKSTDGCTEFNRSASNVSGARQGYGDNGRGVTDWLENSK